MGNISKQKRDKIVQILKELRDNSNSIELKAKINEVELFLTEQKYGIVYEKHQENVYTKLKTQIPVFSNVSELMIENNKEKPFNFILEGDNLHSLVLLSKTHKKSFDVIYIDPPYNTGASDWKYNNDYVDKKDGYRHSKWLSMMYERLTIAKKLLKNDGVLICAIDENELATLSLLLDDIFGIAEDFYKIDTVCVVHNPRGVQGDNFSYTNEYALFVYRKGYNPIENRDIPLDEISWDPLRNWGSESLRSDAATCFYSINVKDNKIIGFGPNMTDVLDFHPSKNVINNDGSISIYPIDKNGIERKWRYNRESVEKIVNLLRVKCSNGEYDIEFGKNFGSYRTVWTDKKYDANEYGTKLINDIIPENDFSFPKSLFNVYDCLYSVIKNRPNAKVLDFFAGSGTTGHAVLLMNHLIGGNRSFVLCTNNDVGDKKEKEFKKEYPHLVINKKIIEDSSEFIAYKDKYGIARSITYPRIKNVINGYISKSGSKDIIYEQKLSYSLLKNSDKMSSIFKDIDKLISKNEYDKYETKYEDDCLRLYAKTNKNQKVNGLDGNLMYYKTEFVDKFSNDFEISELLLPHIKELINLKYGINVSEENLILDDAALNYLLNNINKYENREIYISPYVLLDDDDYIKFEHHYITFKRIPDYFYEYELKEVSEL